jgi:hypothetical protein
VITSSKLAFEIWQIDLANQIWLGRLGRRDRQACVLPVGPLPVRDLDDFRCSFFDDTRCIVGEQYKVGPTVPNAFEEDPIESFLASAIGDETRNKILRFPTVRAIGELAHGAGFLKKYGFGKSRGYILRYEGHDYDSKAIAGVAFGIQHKTSPLRPGTGEIHGGVKPREAGGVLKTLGFEIVEIAGLSVKLKQDSSPECSL